MARLPRIANPGVAHHAGGTRIDAVLEIETRPGTGTRIAVIWMQQLQTGGWPYRALKAQILARFPIQQASLRRKSSPSGACMLMPLRYVWRL